MCSDIYYANYDESFKNLLLNIFKTSKIHDKYIEILLSSDSIDLYKQAFIHHSIHSQCNYEYYEFKGDLTVNKVIIEYLCKIYPFLCCKDGVKVLSRLKILFTSKKTLSEIGNNLNFWNYISSSNNIRQTKKKSLLEDVFESFIGMTEYIISKHYSVGIAYTICYKIISKQLKKINKFSLSYEDLFDAKTRLKEICDYYKHTIGKILYSYNNSNKYKQVRIYHIKQNEKKLIGEGTSNLLIDAEQEASTNALISLKKIGIEKPMDLFYQNINKFSVNIL